MSTIHDVNRRLHCGQTGPLDLLALGASHPHIAVVAVAADVITAAGVGDPTSLHPECRVSSVVAFPTLRKNHHVPPPSTKLSFSGPQTSVWRRADRDAHLSLWCPRGDLWEVLLCCGAALTVPTRPSRQSPGRDKGLRARKARRNAGIQGRPRHARPERFLPTSRMHERTVPEDRLAAGARARAVATNGSVIVGHLVAWHTPYTC